MKIKLTEKQLDNLKYVLEELPKHAEKNPHVESEFDMGQYGCYFNSKTPNTCETHGCLLGHIATLPKFDFNDYLTLLGEFSYTIFGKKEFFKHNYPEIHTSNYIFSSHWSFHQPTLQDALNRVERLVEHGHLVKEFSYGTGEIISSETID